jgi:cell division protein FtsN
MAGEKKGIKDESGHHESSDFGEIEKEIGLGDLSIDENDMESGRGDTPKGRNHKLKHLKKVLFVLFLSVMALTVLGVSLILGKKIFSMYKAADRDIVQEDIARSGKEIPNVTLFPKADEPAKGAEDGKSGVQGPAPATTVRPVSDPIAKTDHPVLEKKMVQPAPDRMDSPARPDRPATAVAKPEATAQADKPVTTASTVKPETKAPKPAAGKNAAVAKAPKTHREYQVIVGSFSIQANAEILSNQLKAHHYKPRVVLAETPKGKLYRVVAGSYRSLRVTKAKMAELKKLGFQSFFIVE